MFQQKITKLTRWNLQQTRVLAVTMQHVYLFGGKKINRKHKIVNIGAIVLSTVSNEIVLHFPKSKDLRISGLDA